MKTRYLVKCTHNNLYLNNLITDRAKSAFQGRTVEEAAKWMEISGAQKEAGRWNLDHGTTDLFVVEEVTQ